MFADSISMFSLTEPTIMYKKRIYRRQTKFLDTFKLLQMQGKQVEQICLHVNYCYICECKQSHVVFCVSTSLRLLSFKVVITAHMCLNAVCFHICYTNRVQLDWKAIDGLLTTFPLFPIS